MFNSLTAIQKKGGVIVLFILMLFGAYSFSFKKTFELKSELERKTEIVKNLDASKLEIEQLKKKLARYSLNLKIDETTLQNTLLEQVSGFCNAEKNMEIKAFLPVHEYLLDDKTIHTCSFSVSGNYFKLLKLHAFLEKTIENAELASIEYELHTERNSKELLATYHVQNLSKNE